MRRLLTILASAALLAGLIVSPAAAATTTGTWAQYPTGATVYQAEVQQPINTANTSNWSSKSKGAIPVMFKLSAGAGPAVFESIYTDNVTTSDGDGVCGTGSQADHRNDCAILQFTPTAGTLTFNQIQTLSTVYTFDIGDCHGGSLRWTLAVMHNGSEQQVHVYYGNPNGDTPAGQSCTGLNSGSGKNLINDATLPVNRFEMAGGFGGGPVYTTYAATQAVVGGDQILRASLIIDSGWGGDQRLTISDSTVNDNVGQWNNGGDGTFTTTCDLPAATIQVGKTDPVTDGPINEEPVQQSLFDSGNAFRVVDCKYQYILSIPSLQATGAGTYWVEIRINGTRVPTPGSTGGSVKFDIK
jgi:hypothetical protein